MASCKLCGVSFGTPEQVRAHIQGSAGEHAGIGFRDAEEYISEAPDETDDPAPEADPAGEPASDPPSSPSKDGGLGVPQRAPRPSSEDDPTCPECEGNRYFDASEHTDYDYGCADCSDADSWVVWNA